MKFLFDRYECLSYTVIKSTFSNVAQRVSPADSSFGGLGVSALAFGTQVHRFKPG